LTALDGSFVGKLTLYQPWASIEFQTRWVRTLKKESTFWTPQPPAEKWQIKCYLKPMEARDTMPTDTSTTTQPRIKMFLDIPTAADLAGFSLRHFRRIIEEDRIPIVQIGRKFFILGRDFMNWQAGKRVRQPV
jgi:hypothetical protein